ncbi:MAG: HD domain-containing protein [bacterium]|nr:HD domain-containing protein [bacterium]
MGMASQPDLALSGGGGTAVSSSRAGYLPVCLSSVPSAALAGIPLHLRSELSNDGAGFVLHRDDRAGFTEKDRRRLLEDGIDFVYIRISDQRRFREQNEAQLEEFVADPSRTVQDKAALLHGTCNELLNELMTDPEVVITSPRLKAIASATAALVLDNPDAFCHMFCASRHDFYTATHMVNTGAWMVPLAYQLGYHDSRELAVICQAGMMHDIGKIHVPGEVLNKTDQLTDADWELIRAHPVSGSDYVTSFDNVDPLVATVARQHHERLDGSGYPDGLSAAHIHDVSKMCAVVDSFDAMTAFRPFKNQTMSVAQALAIIREESPEKYESRVMEAWLNLVGTIPPDSLPGPTADEPTTPSDVTSRRRHQRYTFHCLARVHVLKKVGGRWVEQAAVPVVAHSISRSGLGFLSSGPIELGEKIRIQLQVQTAGCKTLQGETVRCRAHEDGWHEVGMQFSALSAASTPA